MGFFAGSFLWNGILRIFLFWAIVVGALWGQTRIWPWLDAKLVEETFREAVAGRYAGISTQGFAFALASGLGALALALAAAFLVLHMVMIPLAIRTARRRIARAKDMAGFTTTYAEIHKAISRHPLIGHAWREFDETLVPPKDEGGVYRNTVRPQSFINMSVARERLVGLKLMGSIPSYFVGVGLLLTFIGLVLALSKAAAAVNSTDADGMQAATRELLQVATFKFSTSIAGLGASIALSFLFKIYSVYIEGAFDRFCHEVEGKLRYSAPQSIAAEMNDTLAGQLTELKQINSADFFSRMGESISPQIQAAFSSAIAPVTASIDHAVGRLADNSQSGISDLVTKFTESVQGGAGAELRELAGTLQAMQATLLDAQRGIQGSGEDFGRRMAEAAENLNRLVSDAGDKLGAGSEQSRAAFVDVVAALRETMEQAGRKVDEGLGQAAAGASTKVEEAMGRVLEKLEGQVAAFSQGLGGFQDGMTRQVAATQERVAAAQAGAVEAVGNASAEAARALKEGLGDALRAINEEVERFTAAMRTTETTLSAQSNAVREATTQSRAVADAFSRTAQDVRVAAVPLVQSGERIAGATDRMTETIGRSVAALEAGQTSAQSLAEALAQHNGQLAATWAKYADRFEGVDKSLADAVATLGAAAQEQGQILSQRVSEIDAGFATAIDKLNPFLAELTDNTAALGEEVERLRMTFVPQAAE
jgi:hypothetical protein